LPVKTRNTMKYVRENKVKIVLSRGKNKFMFNEKFSIKKRKRNLGKEKKKFENKQTEIV
jgi:hypothetical protein